ncbi:MAG: tetratricopeptide repeat protein [Bacteriovoracia bacterium]
MNQFLLKIRENKKATLFLTIVIGVFAFDYFYRMTDKNYAVRASFFMEKGYYDKARSYYLKALRQNPEDNNAHFGLGWVHQLKNEMPDAQREYGYAIKSAEIVLTSSLYNLAVIAQNQGDLVKASEFYERLLTIKPNSANALHNYGMVLRQKGELEKSLAHFQKADQLNPNSFYTLFFAAQVSEQLHRIPQAANYYEQALRVNPASIEAKEKVKTLKH